MRKISKLMLLLALVFSLTVTAFAEEGNLKLSNVTAQEGETIYVTAELTQTTVGNSLGVTYTYDSKYLKPIPSSCSWARTGLLQDFDRQGGIGVWAVEESTDLKGGVCILAFALQPGAKFTQTTIECTLIVKDETGDVGEYTAEAKVTMDCQHTYGVWTDRGELGHSRTCGLCGGQQTQSHEWDDGVVTNGQGNLSINSKTYTCQICKATKTVDTSEQADPTKPTTVPEAPTSNDPVEQSTQPHAGVTPNTPGTTSPVTGEQDQNVTGPNEDIHDGSDPTYSHEGAAGESTSLEDLLEQYEDEHAGHDHTAEGGGGPATAIAVFAALAVLIGGLIWFVKKKR